MSKPVLWIGLWVETRWERTTMNAILSVQAMREIGIRLILSHWLGIVNPYSLWVRLSLKPALVTNINCVWVDRKTYLWKKYPRLESEHKCLSRHLLPDALVKPPGMEIQEWWPCMAFSQDFIALKLNRGVRYCAGICVIACSWLKTTTAVKYIFLIWLFDLGIASATKKDIILVDHLSSFQAFSPLWHIRLL